MTSHIARGFHRTGVVVALPILLLAAGLAGREEWLPRTTQDPGYHASFGTPAAPTRPCRHPLRCRSRDRVDVRWIRAIAQMGSVRKITSRDPGGSAVAADVS